MSHGSGQEQDFGSSAMRLSRKERACPFSCFPRERRVLTRLLREPQAWKGNNFSSITHHRIHVNHSKTVLLVDYIDISFYIKTVSFPTGFEEVYSFFLMSYRKKLLL